MESGIYEAKAKDVFHKHCTLIDKIMSQGNMLTIQMLLFMYTGNEKLSKWVVFVLGKFFTVVVEGYLWAREEVIKINMVID